MSPSMQCSGDALADRLKLLLHSQKSAIDKRVELATLLKELTRCTSDSVIEEMTNSVVEVKDDTQLHVEFLNGMYANLVAHKLTTSGKNAVLNVFIHHLENHTRVGIIDRAFQRLQHWPHSRLSSTNFSEDGSCTSRMSATCWAAAPTMRSPDLSPVGDGGIMLQAKEASGDRRHPVCPQGIVSFVVTSNVSSSGRLEFDIVSRIIACKYIVQTIIVSG